VTLLLSKGYPRVGRPERGMEGATLTARKPWQAENVSRATWYRRLRSAEKIASVLPDMRQRVATIYRYMEDGTVSIEQTDKEAAAHAVAPRVTLDDIKANIEICFYLNGSAIPPSAGIVERAPDFDSITGFGALRSLTLCVMVLRNGFVVIGKSVPASRENFNVELGCKFAYEDAVRQVWPLMGYALRERLHEAAR